MTRNGREESGRRSEEREELRKEGRWDGRERFRYYKTIERHWEDLV